MKFSSARPRGILTVYAGGKQVLKRRYRFVEKKNFLIRKGVSGSFHEAVELPQGTSDLKFYVTQPKRPTQHRPVTVDIRPGETSTLHLRVQADGKFVISKG